MGRVFAALIRHGAYHLGLLELQQFVQLSMFHVWPIYLQYIPEAEWRHVAGERKERSAKQPMD